MRSYNRILTHNNYEHTKTFISITACGGGGNSPITFYLTDRLNNLHQFNIPYSMTWGEFVTSEYNPVNEIGDKSFKDVVTIQYGVVYSEDTPDGMDYWTEYVDVYKTPVYDLVFSDEYIEKDINYLI